MWSDQEINRQVVFREVKSEWNEILNFVVTCTDIKKHICSGCPTSRLYDKNGKVYIINRQSKLEGVKFMIDQIRKINSECSPS